MKVASRRPSDSTPAGSVPAANDRTPPLEPHVGLTRQYWRDIILGLNDGLVSMLLLVAGVVGGGMSKGQIVLTGVAGAIAGAVSMGAGEYLATRSQEQVLDSELALERIHIRHYREQEVDELRTIFSGMGVNGGALEDALEAFADDEVLFNAMKALEFGIVDSERRKPYMAMAFSGLLFLVGSIPPVVPFVALDDPLMGLAWATGGTAAALFAVGVVKTFVTRGNKLVAGAENLVIAGIGGVIAYFIGAAVGTGGAV